MQNQANIVTRNMIHKIFESIDSFGWIILLAFTPLFLTIKPEQSWLLFVLPLTWMISFLAKKQPIPKTPINLALLVIAIQVLVSLYATYDIAVSLQKVTGVIWGISVFFALVRLSKKRKGVIITTLVFLASGAGIAVLGLLGIEWPTNKIILFNTLYENIPTLSALLPGLSDGFHPNEVGGALTWILPFWIVMLFWPIFSFKKIKRFIAPIWIIMLLILNGLLLSLGSLVLLFSQSRSAYIGMAFGLIVMLFVVLPKKLRFVFILLFLIGFGFLLFFILNGQFMVFSNQLFPESGMASMAFSMNTMSGRIEIWSRAIYAIQDFAFTGMGMNTFRTIVNVLYPLQTISADVPIKDIGHAHNLFLQVALDLGIPGLIGFIAFYLISFWMLISSIQRLRKPSERDHHQKNITKEMFTIISIGLLGGQVAHLMYGMTDAIAFGAKPGILFWVMQSIICGIYLKVRDHDYR
ncbi:MAG: O-antigen ligase family protein [Anaerolineaceae bacterium]|nr:O-antigen ligase family protein [Anaerolineaceae bacterium]